MQEVASTSIMVPSGQGQKYYSTNETGDTLSEQVSLWDEFSGIESENISGEEPITEPFDPASIRITSKQMTIDLLLARIDREELDLQPSFQRKGGIWNDGAQSRLIESLLIRIPLPAFYVDATNDEKWLVVDGLQRLTALKRFIIDKNLQLSKLEFLQHLIGKRYSELSRPLQRRIAETQVTVYLIEEGTPPEVKFNIFKRINTGDLPLSFQEIRHVLNQGKASELLARLALSREFQEAINNSIKDDRMADRECVLRFLAFAITPYTQYRAKEYDTFLNSCMEKINKMSGEEIFSLEQRFLRAMRAAYVIFGKDAFRKRPKISSRRSPINKALFESWSVNLDHLSDRQLDMLIKRSKQVKEKFFNLMNIDEFDEAISQGTGHINKVHLRFSSIEHLIEEVLHD